MIMTYLQGSISDTNINHCLEGGHNASVLGDECDDSSGCQYCAVLLWLSHYNLQEVLPIKAQSTCCHTVALYTADVVHCHSNSTVYTLCLHSCYFFTFVWCVFFLLKIMQNATVNLDFVNTLTPTVKYHKCFMEWFVYVTVVGLTNLQNRKKT